MAKSYSQLVQERQRLDELIEAARKREAEGVIKRIREAVQVYGITHDDIFGQTKTRAARKTHTKARAQVSVKRAKAAKKHQPTPKGSKRPVKYTDGNGNTWAGGGSMPVWLRELVNQGHDKDEFLVRRAA